MVSIHTHGFSRHVLSGFLARRSAPLWAVEQLVVGVGRRVAEEGVHFLGRRGQTDQVEGGPADQLLQIGAGGIDGQRKNRFWVRATIIPRKHGSAKRRSTAGQRSTGARY